MVDRNEEQEAATLLTGIDGSNPLGFLAALGLLRILNEGDYALTTMRWRLSGVWSPELRGAFRGDELAAIVRTDLASWQAASALSLSYDKKSGKRAMREEKGSDNEVKASPSVMRVFLGELAELAAAGHRRDADLLAALVSDIAVAGDGKCKPTALHFMSGNQRFLRTANQARDFLLAQTDEVFAESCHEALTGPWLRVGRSKSFTWDPSIQRNYALRARDPSGDGKNVTVPVAEWLALRGLASFPSFPKGTRLRTAGVYGDWSGGLFYMLLWDTWCSIRAATCLQQTVKPSDTSAAALLERLARGVCAVWRCPFERHGQGYGRFLPAEPA